MPAKSKAKKHEPLTVRVFSDAGFPKSIEIDFHMASDAERGIVSVVYQCANRDCRDTQTIRFSDDDAIFPSTCCVKCRAGFGNDPGGMFPVLGDEAAP